MPTLFVGRDEAALRQLQSGWYRVLNEGAPDDEKTTLLPLDDKLLGRNRGLDAYVRVCDWLDSWLKDLGGGAPRELRTVLQGITPVDLSAVGVGELDAVVAMLILTYPEVRWVAASCVDPIDSAEHERWKRVYDAGNVYTNAASIARDPLFDPAGWREWVRDRTNRDLESHGLDMRLPVREARWRAAAIDEEPAYAYLHAYTAYRFGCRADVVTTWQTMDARFGCRPASSAGDLPPHGYWLLLEDLSLNFGDRPDDVHLLDLEERGRCCRTLDSTGAAENSEHRIVITTGVSRPGDSVLSRNRDYLRRKLVGRGKIVLKPLGGMFDLWRECGLLRKDGGGRRAGNVGGFESPPPPMTGLRTANPQGGHGAPGRLGVVADMLVRRAKLLLGTVASVEDAVRCAVLATDALEYTGGRTPTTAIEALSLKHRFEVLAECQFSGVEYHLSIAPRLAEIRTEMAAIAAWYAPERRANAMLNGEMTVLHGIVDILRSNSQFDEEQVCVNRIRYLHHTLWVRQRPLRLVMLPILRYLGLLLGSFGVFMVALLAWVLGLAVLFTLANGYTELQPGFADALSSFFSVGAPVQHALSKTQEQIPWAHIAVVCLALVSGFVHLGVFISHLYTSMSRR